jgi:hypothetical protein
MSDEDNGTVDNIDAIEPAKSAPRSRIVEFNNSASRYEYEKKKSLLTPTTGTMLTFDSNKIQNNSRTMELVSTRLIEEAKQLEYYKSNPLREFAPTRGQTILPKTKKNKGLNINNHLADIYNELRITSDVQKDRNLHKQQMKRLLNVNFFFFYFVDFFSNNIQTCIYFR